MTDSLINIIVTHGLGGDPLEAWRSKIDGTTGDSGPIWIRDYLKDRWPNARIFTCGYDTGRAFWNDCIASISDVGETLLSRLQEERRNMPSERPIPFICHSLGGIVLKAALVKAREQRRHEWISPIPKGVVFFGTPHMGSRVADDLYRIAKVVPFANHKWPKLLRDRSKELLSLSDSFANRADELVYIVSLFEKVTTGVTRKVVVDKRSATLGLTSEKETRLGIGDDHHGICKFQSKQDRNYILVLGELRRMIEDKLRVGLQENDPFPTAVVASPAPRPVAITSPAPIQGSGCTRASPPEIRQTKFGVTGLIQAADEAFQRGKEDDIERAYQLYGQAKAVSVDQLENSRLFAIHDRMARCALRLCSGSRRSNMTNGTDTVSLDAQNCNMLVRARELSWESKRFVEKAEDEYRAWMTGFCIRILEAERESADGGLDAGIRARLFAEAEEGEQRVLHLLESECEVGELLADLHKIKSKLGRY